MSETETRERLTDDEREEPATDEDWASPRFDYLQEPVIANVMEGRNWYTPEEREAVVQRLRDTRPYLIANIRRNLGDPKWEPRGGRVIALNLRPDEEIR